jgi:hypothetical protein
MYACPGCEGITILVMSVIKRLMAGSPGCDLSPGCKRDR